MGSIEGDKMNWNITLLQRPQTREMTKESGGKGWLKRTRLLRPLTQSVRLWEALMHLGLWNDMSVWHHGHCTCHHITLVWWRPKSTRDLLPWPCPSSQTQYSVSLLPRNMATVYSVFRYTEGFGSPSTGKFHTSPVNYFWGQKYRELSLKFLMRFIKETRLTNSAATYGHVSWYEEKNSQISAPRDECHTPPLRTYF